MSYMTSYIYIYMYIYIHCIDTDSYDAYKCNDGWIAGQWPFRDAKQWSDARVGYVLKQRVYVYTCVYIYISKMVNKENHPK